MRLFFLALPWLELFTLIQLGIASSALSALLYVFATFVLGMLVLRRQGRGMFERLRQAQQGGAIGPNLLLDDMAMGLAGLLLMVPGVITDFAALIVMIGPLRRRLLRWVSPAQVEPYAPQRDRTSHTTLEGEFRHIDD